MTRILTAFFLVVASCTILGAAAALDYSVTCTSESQTSPLWKDAHKAENIIRKEPLDSERCCQLNDGNDAEACTTIVEVGTAIIKMCQPEGRIVCTRCDWAGKALLSVLKQCTVQDSKDNLIYASGKADFTQSAFSLIIEKAGQTEQQKDREFIEMRTSQ